MQHPLVAATNTSYETFSGDTSTLKPETLVAVNHTKYPQIGEVLCSDQDTVTLSQYTMDYIQLPDRSKAETWM